MFPKENFRKQSRRWRVSQLIYHRIVGITGIKKRLGHRRCFPKADAIVNGKILMNFLGEGEQTTNFRTCRPEYFHVYLFMCTANKLVSGLTVLVPFWVWETASFIVNIFLPHGYFFII